MSSLSVADREKLAGVVNTINRLVVGNGYRSVGSKSSRPNRDSDVGRSAPNKGLAAERTSETLTIPNSPIRIDYGLGANGNYISVFDAGGLDWDEGFHRQTHDLTGDDVTGWNSNRPEYGVFFAVRYGRNRDLFQFYRLKLEGGNIVVKTPFWDSYSRDDHIELVWGFDRGDSVICTTKPYGRHGDHFQWAYNFDPVTEQWSGFEI